jgi:hypothetical protein
MVDWLDNKLRERYHINMNDMNVDPNAVINDLLEQIKQLTINNSVLRAALKQAQQDSNALEGKDGE